MIKTEGDGLSAAEPGSASTEAARYEGELLSMARGLNSAAADDLVSRTLQIAIMEKPEKFLAAPDRRGWLLQTLRHVHQNSVRAGIRRTNYEAQFAKEQDQTAPPGELGGLELAEAFANLARRDRISWWLHEYGYTQDEIHSLLGESRKKVAQRIRRTEDHLIRVGSGASGHHRVEESEIEHAATRIQRDVFTKDQLPGSSFSGKAGQATSDLQSALERHLVDLNERVILPVEELGWSGVALYCVDSTLRVLEAVAATNPAFAGVVRHRLPQTDSEPEGLDYDIEVCTYMSVRAERLGPGYDPRYNSYVFHTCNHQRFQDRLFIILCLARDPEDNSIHQDALVWQREGNTWHPVARGYQLQPVGTLSVSSEVRMSDEVVDRTLRFAVDVAAIHAHRASMQGLCEQILTTLVRAAGATAGALHVCHETSSLFRGKRTSLSFKRGGVFHCTPSAGGLGAVPREGGIGREALRRCIPLHLDENELKQTNAELSAANYKASTAFPLLGAEGRCVGLLYLHYQDVRGLDPVVADLVRFASHEIDAALRSERRSFLREHVFAEVARFAQNIDGSPGERLDAMAHFAWNLLGCDHVSVVLGNGHDPDEERIVRDAGRYLTTAAVFEHERTTLGSNLHAELRRMVIPSQAEFLERDVVHSAYRRGDFAIRENIGASAIVPLSWNDNPVGLMVIDYRGGPHDFTSERELILGLARFFAAGILAMQGHQNFSTEVIREGCNLQRWSRDLAPAAPLTIEQGSPWFDFRIGRSTAN